MNGPGREATYRRAMAAVYVLPDDTPWQVIETAREVVALIEEAQGPFISPPKNMDDEDDQ